MKAHIIPTLLNEQRTLPWPLPRPKAHTVGSVPAQQSLLQQEDFNPSASRMQMNRACAKAPLTDKGGMLM